MLPISISCCSSGLLNRYVCWHWKKNNIEIIRHLLKSGNHTEHQYFFAQISHNCFLKIIPYWKITISLHLINQIISGIGIQSGRNIYIATKTYIENNIHVEQKSSCQQSINVEFTLTSSWIAILPNYKMNGSKSHAPEEILPLFIVYIVRVYQISFCKFSLVLLFFIN